MLLWALVILVHLSESATSCGGGRRLLHSTSSSMHKGILHEWRYLMMCHQVWSGDGWLKMPAHLVWLGIWDLLRRSTRTQRQSFCLLAPKSRSLVVYKPSLTTTASIARSSLKQQQYNLWRRGRVYVPIHAISCCPCGRACVCTYPCNFLLPTGVPFFPDEYRGIY